MNHHLLKFAVASAAATVLMFGTNLAFAQRAGQSMSVQTGVVIAAQAVNLQSAAGRGAVVGGVAGLATTSRNRSTSRRIRNTAIGAGTGALIARGAEGNLDGMQYTIETGPGSQIVVVTDQTQVRIGDCVTVEQAGTGTANVRRVSDALCEAAFSTGIDEDLNAYMQYEADMCLNAKERLMEAETDEAFEVAMRRVKFLCDD